MVTLSARNPHWFAHLSLPTTFLTLRCLPASCACTLAILANFALAGQLCFPGSTIVNIGELNTKLHCHVVSLGLATASARRPTAVARATESALR